MSKNIFARWFRGSIHNSVSENPMEWQTPPIGEDGATNRKAEDDGAPVSVSGLEYPYGFSNLRVSPLKDPTVIACINALTSPFQRSVFRIERRNDDGAWERHDGPDYQEYAWLLNGRANETDNAGDLMAQMLVNKLIYGVGYAYIIRDKKRPSRVERWYVPSPFAVNRERIRNHDPNGPRGYVYHINDENHEWENQTYFEEDIIRLPAVSNPLTGESLSVTDACEAALRVKECYARWIANTVERGGSSDYAVLADRFLSPENREQVAKSLAKRSPWQALVVSGQFKLQKLGLSPKEVELDVVLSSANHDICRAFSVPPHLAGFVEKTSWQSGLDAMTSQFFSFTLANHCVQLENEISNKFFSGRQEYRIIIDLSDFLEGSKKDQVAAARGLSGGAGSPGILTPNEIRVNLGYPPVAGGDKLFEPNKGGMNEDSSRAAAPGDGAGDSGGDAAGSG